MVDVLRQSCSGLERLERCRRPRGDGTVERTEQTYGALSWWSDDKIAQTVVEGKPRQAGFRSGPVLPFVFARADRPFVRSGLPLLVGMAATFAAVATLAAIGGGWAVRANQYGRQAYAFTFG